MTLGQSYLSLWITFVTLLLSAMCLPLWTSHFYENSFSKTLCNLICYALYSGISLLYFGAVFYITPFLGMMLFEAIWIGISPIKKTHHYGWMLTIEFVLTSAPFVYLAIAYEESIWYTFISAFLIGQLLRYRVGLKHIKPS